MVIELGVSVENAFEQGVFMIKNVTLDFQLK